MKVFRLLTLNNVPIFEQLRLEEALLRTSRDNWFLLNSGSSDAIVMGISGKQEELLDCTKVAADKIPIIKRFSGGGTVYVDHQTVFATLICNQQEQLLSPKEILQFSEQFYQPLFTTLRLRENDFVFGEKKIGGNAQYLQKGRWLLHTSFLWDFSPHKMEYLLLPQKRPIYRGARSHCDFLCTLRPHFPDKNELILSLEELLKKSYPTQITSLEEASLYLNLPHRRSTVNISLHQEG